MDDSTKMIAIQFTSWLTSQHDFDDFHFIRDELQLEIFEDFLASTITGKILK